MRRAILAQRAYRKEQAFAVPSVQTRRTSSVRPSSRRRATGDGPTGDGDPDQLALVVSTTHGELAADRRQRMPVMFGHELVGLAEMKRDCTHMVSTRQRRLSLR